MKLFRLRLICEVMSAITIAGTIILAATGQPARAAELVMFEQTGCEWCATFDREIAPIYPKTAEGRRAPLRRVNISAPLPADLAFIRIERFTPLFVLIDKNSEIGQIRGYPGEDHFWGLLGVLIQRLDADGTSENHGRRSGKPLLAAN